MLIAKMISMTRGLSRYMRTDVISRPKVWPTFGNSVKNSEKLPRVNPGTSTMNTAAPPTACTWVKS